MARAKAEETLTLVKVNEWLKQLRDARKTVEAQWKTQQALYDGKYDFQTPQVVKDKGLVQEPSIGYRIIHMLVDHMTTEQALVHCDPKEEDATHKEAATEVEEWSQAWLAQQANDAFLALREPPARAASKMLCLRDMGVAKVTLDVDATGDEPQSGEFATTKLYEWALRRWERDAQYAQQILLRSRDPVSVYPDPGGRFAIETYMRSPSEIERLYDYEVKGGSEGKPVRWTECWTPTQRLYAVESEVIEVRKHRYGFIPHIIGYGGWGQGSTMAPGDTDTTGSSGGVHRQVTGALWAVRSELKERARRMTHMVFLLHQNAYADPVITGAPDGMMPEGWKMQMGTGIPTVMPPGTSLDYFRPVLPMRELLELITLLDMDIARATGPDILAGFRPQGVNTVGQTEILAAFGRMKLGPAIASLNAMFTKALEYALRLIEDVHEKPVTIIGASKRDLTTGRRVTGRQSRTLDPAKLRLVYFPEVTFIPTLPFDRAASIAMGKQLEDDISTETWLEKYAGVEDGAREVERKRKEIITKAYDLAITEATVPLVQQAAVQRLQQQVPQLVTAEQERGGMVTPVQTPAPMGV